MLGDRQAPAERDQLPDDVLALVGLVRKHAPPANRAREREPAYSRFRVLVSERMEVVFQPCGAVGFGDRFEFAGLSVEFPASRLDGIVLVGLGLVFFELVDMGVYVQNQYSYEYTLASGQSDSLVNEVQKSVLISENEWAAL